MPLPTEVAAEAAEAVVGEAEAEAEEEEEEEEEEEVVVVVVVVVEPAVGEAVAAARAEALVGAVLELEPVLAEPVVVAEPVELALVEPVRELEGVAGRVMAVAVILPDILTPVHTDGPTTTGSARERSGIKGAISLGLAAVGLALVTLGLAAPLLVGPIGARPSRLGMCGDTRRAYAMSRGLATLRG